MTVTSKKKGITQLAMAYHLCPLPGYEWNLEQLERYAGVFNGPKVVGLATMSKVSTAKVVDEIYAALGTDTIIKQVVNDPINREAVTFPNIMRYLDLKVDKNKTAVWYGHSKGITHVKRKYRDVTKLWAAACYHYTLSPEYLSKAISFIDQGYSIAGPFRRYGEQRNFPPQRYKYHYSGTFFWVHAGRFFASDWKKIPKHRYAIEALPGMLFPPEESQCTFGDRAKDLYKEAVWTKLLKPEVQEELVK